MGVETVVFKGQKAVNIMQGLLSVSSWLISITAAFVSCCCAPTIEQVLFILFNVNWRISKDWAEVFGHFGTTVNS